MARTADDDAEEDTHDEVPDGHDDHNAEDRDVLVSAHAMPGVPKRFFDEVDTEHKDERADNHNSCIAVVSSGQAEGGGLGRTNVGDGACPD